MSNLNIMQSEKNSNASFYIKSTLVVLGFIAINFGFSACMYQVNQILFMSNSIGNIASFTLVIAFFLISINYAKKILNKLDNP